MSGFFSPALIEQVRQANDIVDVIGAALPLKRAGGNFVTLCPFHKEKSPSFSVSPQKQMFHCFGCHKGGNVFTFIREYENLSFPEAVRRLAERARIPIEFETGPGQENQRSLRESLLQIHDQITNRWQAALANDPGGQIARDYLKKRGVTAEAIKQFRLGYAPELWDDTVNWAKSKNYEAELVEQAGLILKRDSGMGFYDRFRGRLMFPICDEQGRVIGFSGRILSGDEKTAKYVNSPETPIFTKGKVIFGLDKSKRALMERQFAIVCEGQLDLIACFTADVQNVVAPQGTALTADHARILKRYVNEVVLCFDSDVAGQKAAVRSIDDLLAAGLAIRVAVLPSPHDPDSFIKAFGGAAFAELIDRAAGYFDFYLTWLSGTHDISTDKGRVALVRAMGEAVHKTKSAVLMDTYAQRTAQLLDVSVESVRSEFRRGAAPARYRPENAEEPEGMETAADLPRTSFEFWLVKLLMLDDQNMDWVMPRLDRRWIEHPVAAELVELRLKAHRDGTWTGVAGFMDGLANVQARSIVSEAVCDQRNIGNVEELLKGAPGKAGAIARLRQKYIERQLATLNARYSNPNLTAEEKVRLVQEQTELRKLKQQPM